jgi:hypothetical protein
MPTRTFAANCPYCPAPNRREFGFIFGEDLAVPGRFWHGCPCDHVVWVGGQCPIDGHARAFRHLHPRLALRENPAMEALFTGWVQDAENLAARGEPQSPFMPFFIGPVYPTRADETVAGHVMFIREADELFRVIPARYATGQV